MTLNFDSDSFLQLLTDALRAGPGSPAWHEALARMKLASGDSANEYKALLAAREHLESGRGYRQIRAGPRFTRKLMHAVAEEASAANGGAGGPATSTMIALLAGAVALGIIVLVSYLLISSAGPGRQSLGELKGQTFSREILSESFAGGLSAQWRMIGSLSGSFDREFRAPAKAPSDRYVGCGIVIQTPLPADPPSAVEVTLRLAEPNEGAIPQIFVTDRPDFSPDRGISTHGLVWALQPRASHGKTSSEQQIVLPDGTFAAVVEGPRGSRDSVQIRISFDADYVLVDSGGQRIYAGPHQLSPDKPRYVGVRFLRRGDVRPWSLPAVVSIRISQG